MLRLFLRLRQMRTRLGVRIAGACFLTFDRISAKTSLFCGCAFWLLTPLCRLLAIACSRKTGCGGISLMSPGRMSSRAMSSRCQGLSVQVSIGAPILAP